MVVWYSLLEGFLIQKTIYDAIIVVSDHISMQFKMAAKWKGDREVYSIDDMENNTWPCNTSF